MLILFLKCWAVLYAENYVVNIILGNKCSCCTWRLHIHEENLLVTAEAISVQWCHCHDQETSLRWFAFCELVCYPAGSNHQEMTTVWPQMDGHGQQQYWCGLWYLNNAQFVPRRVKSAKETSPTLLADFWPYHPSTVIEIETHQTRQCFSSSLLSIACWTVSLSALLSLNKDLFGLFQPALSLVFVFKPDSNYV